VYPDLGFGLDMSLREIPLNFSGTLDVIYYF
jgi:hypothetical protein